MTYIEQNLKKKKKKRIFTLENGSTQEKSAWRKEEQGRKVGQLHVKPWQRGGAGDAGGGPGTWRAENKRERWAGASHTGRGARAELARRVRVEQ